jgi:hypothetical protein
MAESRNVEHNNREDWQQLCSVAAVEQDSQKLTCLVNQIIKALDERSLRFKNSNPME